MAINYALTAQHFMNNNRLSEILLMIILLSTAEKRFRGRKPMAAVPRVIARVPRIFIVVPGVLAGILVPSLIVAGPKSAPPNTVGMYNMDFTKDVVTLHRGEWLVFVDDSHNIHEVGPGQNGLITSPVRGEPMTGYHLMVTNSVYKTGPWLTPGTFYVTCAVHPMMNLKVVVVP